ncbi:MAG TPA: APC family permease, partial [Alphaproteobacteria bacterium]|nr:APC family permease [Alphaproteobacteria bacterium]
FAKLDDVSFFAQMCLAFVGLELAPVLGGEVKDPQRTFPRAILLSAATIVGCYMLGTLALMWALPSSETSIIAGINQAADKAGVAHGIMWLGPVVALLMTLATMGSVGAYLVGNARMMFVGGLDRYLPPAFGRIHPRWKTPHVALLAQAVLVALLVVAANQGTTVKSAYLKLVNATIILVFIPYLYIFAALIKMRKKIAATPGAVPVPGGAWGTWVWAVLGSLMTLVGMVLAMVPPPDTADKTSFFLQVVGGSFGFLLAGFVIYEVKKWKSGNRRDTPAT